MNKEQVFCALRIIDDCTDIIEKQVEAGLKPNNLLIDYIKERLDLISQYKGE